MNQNTVKDERNWRDSKIPQWAKDQIQIELTSSSLRWPLEPKPSPLPFGYASYNRRVGSIEPGVYWWLSGKYPFKFEVRKITRQPSGWIDFEFNIHPDRDDSKFTSTPVNGPWFNTEREAKLYLLWKRCEEMAKELYDLTEKVRSASDEIDILL